MLKIRKVKCREKFVEMNLRQRVYQGENYITLMITAEFYPTLIGEQVVNGVLEAKVDMKDVHSLDDLVSKKLEGEIGSVTLSVNNDGIWEHQSQDSFQIEIKKRVGREIEFTLSMEEVQLSSKGVLTGLYTTSSSEESLRKVFDLKDFYDTAFVKEFGDKKVLKYFVKE